MCCRSNPLEATSKLTCSYEPLLVKAGQEDMCVYPALASSLSFMWGYICEFGRLGLCCSLVNCEEIIQKCRFSPTTVCVPKEWLRLRDPGYMELIRVVQNQRLILQSEW